MGNKEIHSLPDLLETKEVIVPIIQRDYAQGRNESKANNVRKRLIEDWIEVLEGNKPPMDFNFIYGVEAGGIFYPVDGQQRLTSLFLLYWLLAHMCSDEEQKKIEKVREWKFSYQTRNSAIEFFESLKDQKNDLYKVLKESDSKQDAKNSIQDQNWFKEKWLHDPTILACINFLIDLNDKIKAKEPEKLEKYWNALNPAKENDLPLIKFTYLPEESNDPRAEAAKKYIRMNARGKKLTDFENLKAVLDEIENKEKENGRIDKSFCLVNSFDLIYCDSKYQIMIGGTNEELSKKVEKINNDFLNLIRNVYVCYCYKKGVTPPEKQQVDDTLYNISQGKTIDANISNYLKCLKAVLDALYPADMDDARKEFSKICERWFISDIKPESEYRTSIIFMLYSEKFCNDEGIISGWKRLYDMIKDLKMDSLDYESDNKKIKVINLLLEGIYEFKKQNSISLDEAINAYFAGFINNDDKKWDAFPKALANASNELDILSRIREQVMKSALLMNKVWTKDHIEKVNNCLIGSRRYGWFFYLLDLDFGSISIMNTNMKDKVEKYIQILVDQIDSLEFRLAFAYTSQTDSNKKLMTQQAINQSCGSNIHIYSSKQDFDWTDTDASIEKEKTDDYFSELKGTLSISDVNKTKKLEVFHNMMELIYNSPSAQQNLLAEPIKHFNEEKWKDLDDIRYSDCWLRVFFKLKFGIQNREYLIEELLKDKELKYDVNKNLVLIEDCGIPVLLYCFLNCNGYQYFDAKELVFKKDTLGKKYFMYLQKNELMPIVFRELGRKPDNGQKNDLLSGNRYEHSSDPGFSKRIGKYNRHINCDYSNYIRLNTQTSNMPEGVYSYEFDQNNLILAKRYEVKSINNNVVNIEITEYHFSGQNSVSIKDTLRLIVEKCKEYNEEWNELWTRITQEKKNDVFQGPATDCVLEIFNGKTGNQCKQLIKNPPHGTLNASLLTFGYSDDNSTQKTWKEKTFIDCKAITTVNDSF